MKRYNQREAETEALRTDLAAIGAELITAEPVVKVRGSDRAAIVGVLEKHGIIAFEPTPAPNVDAFLAATRRDP